MSRLLLLLTVDVKSMILKSADVKSMILKSADVKSMILKSADVKSMILKSAVSGFVFYASLIAPPPPQEKKYIKKIHSIPEVITPEGRSILYFKISCDFAWFVVRIDLGQCTHHTTKNKATEIGYTVRALSTNCLLNSQHLLHQLFLVYPLL